MKISDLVNLKDDELENSLAWIDWRESDSDVLRLYLEQVSSDVDISIINDKDLEISFGKKTYKFPLTQSGSDRYVVLSSCSELLKETHSTFLYRKSLEDDTHGFLVIPHATSNELSNQDEDWFTARFEKLKLGYDYFNDVDIPYLGHEDRLLTFVSNDPKPLERWIHQEPNVKPTIGKKIQAILVDFAKSVLLPLLAIAIIALIGVLVTSLVN